MTFPWPVHYEWYCHRYAQPASFAHDALCAIPSRRSADGEQHTDLIILTHDTVEGRMRQALATMQALPTVLAPIVSIRKEELS